MKNDKILDSLNGPRVSISPSVTTTYTVYAFPFQGFYENYPCAQVPEFDSLGQTTNRKVIKFMVNDPPTAITYTVGSSEINVTSVTGGTPPYEYQFINGFNDIQFQPDSSMVGLFGTYIVSVRDAHGCIYTYPTPILVRLESGFDITGDIHLYPNPAQDFIVLDYNIKDQTDAGLEIYSTLGELIYRTSIPQKGSYEINTHKWSSGIYFLSIKAKDGISFYRQKLVITR